MIDKMHVVVSFLVKSTACLVMSGFRKIDFFIQNAKVKANLLVRSWYLCQTDMQSVAFTQI